MTNGLDSPSPSVRLGAVGEVCCCGEVAVGGGEVGGGLEPEVVDGSVSGVVLVVECGEPLKSGCGVVEVSFGDVELGADGLGGDRPEAQVSVWVLVDEIEELFGAEDVALDGADGGESEHWSTPEHR